MKHLLCIYVEIVQFQLLVISFHYGFFAKIEFSEVFWHKNILQHNEVAYFYSTKLIRLSSLSFSL